MTTILALIVALLTVAPPSTTAPASLFDKINALYPPAIDRFLRIGVDRYTDAGDDVSVGYTRFDDDQTTLIAFTGYFYPLPANDGTFLKHLKTCVEEVRGRYPDWKQISRDHIAVQKNGREFQGEKVVMSHTGDFGTKKQPLISELWLFQNGNDVVLYRITYPADRAKLADQELPAFHQKFDWPN